MAKEVLIVDGYNIINSWQELKKLLPNYDQARDGLLEILSNYQGYKKNEILVVFDAYKTNSKSTSIKKYNNIEVIYTKEAETADTYIEMIANMYGREYQIRVATSDGLEQLMIMSKGGARMSARELHEDIKALTKEYRKDFIQQESTRGNSLYNNLDEEMKAKFEKMRRQK